MSKRPLTITSLKKTSFSQVLNILVNLSFQSLKEKDITLRMMMSCRLSLSPQISVLMNWLHFLVSIPLIIRRFIGNLRDGLFSRVFL
jgi:hypothetical protein